MIKQKLLQFKIGFSREVITAWGGLAIYSEGLTRKLCKRVMLKIKKVRRQDCKEIKKTNVFFSSTKKSDCKTGFLALDSRLTMRQVLTPLPSLRYLYKMCLFHLYCLQLG